MKNPVPNAFTRTIVEYLTDRSDGFCVAEKIREQNVDAFADPRRIKRATITLLVTDPAVWGTARLWRNLLLTALEDPCGVDWNYVSTALATDHATN